MVTPAISTRPTIAELKAAHRLAHADYVWHIGLDCCDDALCSEGQRLNDVADEAGRAVNLAEDRARTAAR